MIEGMETADQTIVHAPNQNAPANRGGDTSQASVAPSRLRMILMEPFRAATWRRLAYILLACPVGLLCSALALVGGPAGRIQARLANLLLDAGIDVRRRHRLRAFTLAVLSAPINLAAVVISFYFWLVVVLNLGYPLRPHNDYKTAWGGPTLAGAWALHAVLGGVVFLFITAWTMRGLTALQARLARGFLGKGRSGLLRTTALALGIALVSGLVAVPVIHQL